MTACRRLAAVAALAVALPAQRAVLGAPQGPGGFDSTLNHFAGFDTIRTAQFHYNLNNGDFNFPAHFYATREGTDITADRANGNSQRKQLHAIGHVVVHQTQPVTSAGGKEANLTQRPSTLSCDTLDVDGFRQLYTANGNMHFTQEGGRNATSDRAVLDESNHRLHMEGHVHVREGERSIDADVLDYDTRSGEVDGNGNVTITSPVETPLPGARPAPTKKPKKKRLF